MSNNQAKAQKALRRAANYYASGDLKCAESAFRDAIRADSNCVEGHNNLGVLLSSSGQQQAAYACFETAFRLQPGYAQAARNLAALALQFGRQREAIAPLESALQANPDDTVVRTSLAESLSDTGQHRAALRHMQVLHAQQPDDVAFSAACGVLHNLLGEHANAMLMLRAAYRKNPRYPGILRDLGVALERARFSEYDAEAEADLIACMTTCGVEPQHLARAAGDLICQKFAIETQVDTRAVAGVAQPDADTRAWVHDPLLRALLRRCINVDPRIESMLVHHRQQVLMDVLQQRALSKPVAEFACHLATQCFSNEFAWPIQAEERAAVTQLKMRLQDPNAATPLADMVIAIALFEPLHGLSSEQLERCRSAQSAPVQAMLVKLLDEPLAEQALADNITAADISDMVSVAVRGQYEESPYPRWIELGEPVREPIAELLVRQYPHHTAASAPSNNNTLVAGCGSGRHALLVALRDPQARVVAIDLSRASLAYAMRKAKQLNIKNVEFRHLDILDAGCLGEQFGVIESFGVLHHMHDPDAGLAALRPLLLPGGAVKLGLYSAKARSVVNKARVRIADLGLGAGPDAVRTLRQRVFAGSEPELETLFESSDFYASSACRDLLFHVQEHQYSAPGVRQFVERQGLEFLGFYFSSDAIPRRYREQNPSDPQLLDTEAWDMFETRYPATFSNCFSFWSRAPA